MGRAGRGSSGGGSRSSGSRSSSRSSGGHRIGGSSSSRAGRGYSSSRPSSSSSYGRSYSSGRNYSSSRHYGPRRHYSGSSSSPRGCLGVFSSFFGFVVAFIIIVVAINVVKAGGSNMGVPASTQNREKLTGTSYNSNCIVDELGWVENTSHLSRELQYFFNKTGVQPYIYLKSYDSSLTNDAAKTAYAEQYYEECIDNEHTFLFMYFGEYDEDDVGYMCYVNGYQVTSVMDAEAVDIFWAYIDRYWYDDISTVDMFDKVFESTADRIMDKTKTAADIGFVAIVIVGIIVVAVIIIIAVSIKRKHSREKAAETAAILNAPIEELAGSDNDDLLDKYSD